MRPLARSDEAGLVVAAQRGDHSAFESLVRFYDKQLFRLALQLTGSQSEAQDIYQEAFLKAYRHIGNFRFESSFSAWIYRIVTNLCIDHLRKREMRREDLHTTDPSGQDVDDLLDRVSHDDRTQASPERDLMRRELGAKISRALSKLTPRERMVFELKHYEGLRLRTIGEMLNTTEETAKNTLFRATQKLRGVLAQPEGLVQESKPATGESPFDLQHLGALINLGAVLHEPHQPVAGTNPDTLPISSEGESREQKIQVSDKAPSDPGVMINDLLRSIQEHNTADAGTVLRPIYSQYLAALAEPYAEPMERLLHVLKHTLARVEAQSQFEYSFLLGALNALLELCAVARNQKAPTSTMNILARSATVRLIAKVIMEMEPSSPSALAQRLGKDYSDFIALERTMIDAGLLRRDEFGRSVRYSSTPLLRTCMSALTEPRSMESKPIQ